MSLFSILFSGLLLLFSLHLVTSFRSRILPYINNHSFKLLAEPATLSVDLGDRSYPIYIGQGLLKSGEELRRHVKAKKALIVTNTLVGPLYSDTVRKALEAAGIEVFEIVLPDGEEYKTMDILMRIMDKAMECKLDRKSVMVALGGGVIGDTAGFAAAIYQRGVKFIQVPTTLMAMVDSAVGGKTAVNHPLGKNIIGAFYQPDAVIIDTDTLQTLPDRELNSGIAEVIKYGLIRDSKFFEWQEENVEAIMSRDAAVLTETILRSCQNKAEVVAEDEKEGGVRATLNLGHTFGHAIESGMGYGAWLHGEAVGTGMAMAADLSCKLGLISPSLRDRAVSLIKRAALPTTLLNPATQTEVGEEKYKELLAGLPKERFLDLMSMDKKVYNGQLNLVLLEGELGKAIVTDKFDVNDLESVVTEYCSK
mmetsp:Transcript_5580/g.5769  ORF Transcript_5580/g.5769 Transcript_5580/m.5769 type:complete len:422 (+) Transcript_5580:134-1399(+)